MSCCFGNAILDGMNMCKHINIPGEGLLRGMATGMEDGLWSKGCPVENGSGLLRGAAVRSS